MAHANDSKPVISQSDPLIRGHIRSMIKLMIDDHDHTRELPYRLTSDDMPMDMKHEGHVLDALYYCAEAEMPPTRDTIVELIILNRRMEEPGKFLNLLIEEHKDERFGLRALCNFVKEWLQERQLSAIGERIKNLSSDSNIGYSEKWEKAWGSLQHVAPSESFVYEDVSEKQFRQLTYDSNQAAVLAKSSGYDIAPRLPYKAAEAFAPSFAFGQSTLIMGPEGTGKTTIGNSLAEYISWSQALNCDCIYFSLETPLEVLSMRQFSRHFYIPYSDTKNAKVDLSVQPYNRMWEQFKEMTHKKNDHSGMIKYFFSPDASVDDIVIAMNRCAEASRLLGHKICFFIDHLHSIDWERTHSKEGEFNALRSIIRKLCATNSRISADQPNRKGVPSHLFILAQQGDEKGQMFGGKFSAKRVQMVISLSRDRFGDKVDGEWPLATEDKPISVKESLVTPDMIKSKRYRKNPDNPREYLLFDALGNQRYFYRKGDEYRETAHLRITKSNDSSLGRIDLKWEGAMNIVLQDNDQVAELRKAKRLPPG